MLSTGTRWAIGITASLILLSGCLLLATRYWPESHWKPLQHQLEKRYGIEIKLDDIDFPTSFRAQSARYRLTYLFERSSVLKRLAIDLSHYPSDFVKENLRGIVILRSLEMNGLPYGGTYDAAASMIFLDSGWLGDDGSKDEAMGFHHEFSSLLMRQHPEVFNMNDWAELNPKDFNYKFSTSTAANLTTNKLDLVGNPQTWEQGFLCAYGQLTLEDDINTFSQYLVVKKESWSQLSHSYPLLVAKIKLLESWYCAIGFSTSNKDCKSR